MFCSLQTCAEFPVARDRKKFTESQIDHFLKIVIFCCKAKAWIRGVKKKEKEKQGSIPLEGLNKNTSNFKNAAF